MDVIELSKKELHHIFLVGAHLHTFQGTDSSSIPQIIKDQGMVQYDPLNPVGRYHDHFFLSRIENYMQGDFERIVYEKKLIFEYYTPNLCAISIEHFPTFWPLMKRKYFFSYYQKRIDKLKSEKPTLLDDVYDFVNNNGVTTGKDLSHLGKANKEYASGKSNQISSSVLEYLWLMGKLAVVERTEQFQKKYNLIEKYIPKKFLGKSGDSDEKLQLVKFNVLHKSFPVVLAKQFSILNGKVTFSKNSLIPIVEEDCDDFIIAKIPEIKKNVVIPSNYTELLSQESNDDHMRLLGVLDPLIWDRELLKKVFDFDYTWEVYKKEQDRKWGYYVFPLLFKGKLLGRLESKTVLEDGQKILKFFNLLIEPSTKITNGEKIAFDSLVKRISTFISADAINMDQSVRKLSVEKNKE